MLGLMGDSSDNIPGCPGVGEKTAQKLVAEFGSIENLLAHTDQLKGALKTKVEANREMITFSKFLATIKVDVPIKLDMTTLVREEPDEEKLRKIFEELEFRTLIDRVLKNQVLPSPLLPTPFHPTFMPEPCLLVRSIVQLLKTTVLFKAICLQILQTTAQATRKIQISRT